MIVHDIPQRSDEWYRLRAGMPTASEFSSIVTSTGAESKSRQKYAYQLAAEKYAMGTCGTWGGNVHLERGRFLEEDALRAYAFVEGVEVVPCGFVTDDDVTHGCSPDGLVGNDGMAEVKCLKAENHISTLLYWRKNGRCPTDYVQQTQGQMMICGRSWCDLIFYHPNLPMFVIRQTPDAEVVAGLRDGISKIIVERDEVVSTLNGVNYGG